MGALMGLSPWKSPVQLWQEKSNGENHFVETEAMRMGHVLEPVVADLFAAKHPDIMVEQPEQETYFHPEHEYLIAHPDRLVAEKDGSKDFGILEIKTSRYGWDVLPAYIELQCRHYMNVVGAEYAYVAALFGGNEYYECKIQRNQLVEQVMMKHADLFMKSLDAGKCAADPSSLDDVMILFPTSDKKLTLTLGDDDKELLSLISKTRNDQQAIKVLEEEVSKNKAKIGTAMGQNHNIKYNGKSVVTYPTVKGRKTFNMGQFKELNPDHNTEPYMKQGKPYRRMTVKGLT